MADNYDDIRGMQFPMITMEGDELTCFVAAIKDNVGLTIKAIDVEEAERMGYDWWGDKEVGNMWCSNLIETPERIEKFRVAVRVLRNIKSGKGKVFDCEEVNKLAGTPANPGGFMTSCAF